MNKPRSKCFTCGKQKGTTELMLVGQAIKHAENFPDHHVSITPDFEEEEKDDFNAA